MYDRHRSKEFEIYEIVDGQQRITTIYLFLFAISQCGKPHIYSDYIKTGEIYRLELGGLNKQFLKDLIDGKNPNPQHRTNKLIRDCFEYFKNQLSIYQKIDDILRYFLGSTLTLEFQVFDEVLAIKTFETLNDRGKPLTLLDKTKSFLMFISQRYISTENRDIIFNKINNAFGRVYQNIDIIMDIGDEERINYLRSDRFSEDEILRFFYHYFAKYAIDKYKIKDNDISYNYDISTEDVYSKFIKKTCTALKMTQTSYLISLMILYLI